MSPMRFDGVLFAINLLTISLGFGLAVAPPPRDPLAELEAVLIPLEREIAARQLAQVTVVPHPDTRVDLFDTRGNRIGYATIGRRSGRVETFNTQSQRTGYGTLRGNTIQFFDNASNRIGSGRIGQ